MNRPKRIESFYPESLESFESFVDRSLDLAPGSLEKRKKMRLDQRLADVTVSAKRRLTGVGKVGVREEEVTTSWMGYFLSRMAARKGGDDGGGGSNLIRRAASAVAVGERGGGRVG